MTSVTLYKTLVLIKDKVSNEYIDAAMGAGHHNGGNNGIANRIR